MRVIVYCLAIGLKRLTLQSSTDNRLVSKFAEQIYSSSLQQVNLPKLGQLSSENVVPLLFSSILEEPYRENSGKHGRYGRHASGTKRKKVRSHNDEDNQYASFLSFSCIYEATVAFSSWIISNLRLHKSWYDIASMKIIILFQFQRNVWPSCYHINRGTNQDPKLRLRNQRHNSHVCIRHFQNWWYMACLE